LDWPEEALGLAQAVNSEMVSWKHFSERKTKQQTKAIKNTTEVKRAQGITSLTNKSASPPTLMSMRQDTLKD